MDVNVDWSYTDDVESLLKSIVQVRQDLDEVSSQQLGKKYMFDSCKVYAFGKNIDLLKKSDLWTDAVEQFEVTMPKYRIREATGGSELVADFALFKLHRSPIMGVDQVRVVCRYVCDSLAPQVFFGTVHVK